MACEGCARRRESMKRYVALGLERAAILFGKGRADELEAPAEEAIVSAEAVETHSDADAPGPTPAAKRRKSPKKVKDE